MKKALHLTTILLSFLILFFGFSVNSFATGTDGHEITKIVTEATIERYVGENDTVVIPRFIDGNPVKLVLTGAFVDTPAHIVYVPDGVTLSNGSFSKNVIIIQYADTEHPDVQDANGPIDPEPYRMADITQYDLVATPGSDFAVSTKDVVEVDEDASALLREEAREYVQQFNKETEESYLWLYIVFGGLLAAAAVLFIWQKKKNN